MALPSSYARRMIAAELFSDLGNQIVHLALLADMFFQRNESTATLFFLYLAQQLPALLLGPWAGSRVDRMGPGAGLLCGSLAKLMLVVGFFFFRNRTAVYGLYFLFMTASLMRLVSRLAITPGIVARDRLVAFNALNEKVTLGANILGPAFIGLFIRHMGTGIALGGSVALYGVSAFLIRGLPNTKVPAAKEAADRSTGWSGRLFRAYLHPLMDQPTDTWAAVLAAAVCIGGVLNFGAPVYNRFFFQGDIVAWGMVMSGYQAGACLAALALPALAARWCDAKLASVCFSLTGLGFALLSLFSLRVLFVLAMAGFGWSFTMLQMLMESRIQRDCPPSRRGAAMAALTSLRGASLMAGLLVGSGVAALAGVRVTMIAGALASAAGLGMVIRSKTMSGAEKPDGTS